MMGPDSLRQILDDATERAFYRCPPAGVAFFLGQLFARAPILLGLRFFGRLGVVCRLIQRVGVELGNENREDRGGGQCQERRD